MLSPRDCMDLGESGTQKSHRERELEITGIQVPMASRRGCEPRVCLEGLSLDTCSTDATLLTVCCVCVCVYMRMCVCVYMCMFVPCVCEHVQTCLCACVLLPYLNYSSSCHYYHLFLSAHPPGLYIHC